MIRFLKGNLLASEAEALVNTVNTDGIMGKGIALQFKNTYQHNFKEYVASCKSGWLQPGRLLIVKDKTLESEKTIINFPTKTKWRQKSQYDYIEIGLKTLVNEINTRNIKSIAIPPLGCGNGGLNWSTVKPMMEKYLSVLKDVSINVYEPSQDVQELLKKEKRTKTIELTTTRAMVLYSLFYYEALGEESSLFVANKLTYFLKRLGEQSLNKIKFEKSHYGPYSAKVGHVMHALNGKYLYGLEQMDAKAFTSIELNYEKFGEVTLYIDKNLIPEQKQRLSDLLDLIDGFQSSLSLKILATVDFVKNEFKLKTESDVIESIKSWSSRKNDLMKDQYIRIAYKHLETYSNRMFDIIS